MTVVALLICPGTLHLSKYPLTGKTYCLQPAVVLVKLETCVLRLLGLLSCISQKLPFRVAADYVQSLKTPSAVPSDGVRRSGGQDGHSLLSSYVHESLGWPVLACFLHCPQQILLPLTRKSNIKEVILLYFYAKTCISKSFDHIHSNISYFQITNPHSQFQTN